MRENVIEHQLCERVKQEGGMCLKFESPGRRGVPDRVVILNGITAFIETKAPGKHERKQQMYVQQLMKDCGALVFSTVDSFEKIEQIIILLKAFRSDKANDKFHTT